MPLNVVNVEIIRMMNWWGCEGSCGKWFHFSSCNLNDTDFAILSKSKNLFFQCDIWLKKCPIVDVGSIKVQNDMLWMINESLRNISLI